MWIESHQELRDHPKTKRLCRLLDVSLAQTVGHLHLLWWWVMDYAPDGNLSGYTAEDISDAGGWEGDALAFVEALVECRVRGEAGFLDRDDDGELHGHDWDEYGGKVYQERERRAAKMRERRAGHVTGTLPVRAEIVQVTCPPRGEESTGHERRGEESRREEIAVAIAPAKVPKPPSKLKGQSTERKPHPHQEQIGALQEALDIPDLNALTDIEKGRFFKAAEQLFKAKRGREDILKARANWWPDRDLTALGLAGNIYTLVNRAFTPRASPNGRGKPNPEIGRWDAVPTFAELPVEYWKEGDDDEPKEV